MLPPTHTELFRTCRGGCNYCVQYVLSLSVGKWIIFSKKWVLRETTFPVFTVEFYRNLATSVFLRPEMTPVEYDQSCLKWSFQNRFKRRMWKQKCGFYANLYLYRFELVPKPTSITSKQLQVIFYSCPKQWSLKTGSTATSLTISVLV